MREHILPHRVSFVVIAKNEIFAITNCIKSIIRCGKTLLDYEIIFIDSLSSDGTLEKVMEIKNKCIRIFQITKNANAAVARNVGLKNVKYEYVFLIDGDVEIQLEFILKAIEEMKNSNQIGAIYGQIKEFQYRGNYEKVIRVIKDKIGIKKRTFQIMDGGIFFTRRLIIKDIGNFDERLKNNEDKDYILRVMSKYKVLGLPIQMGIHHTIPYRSTKRMKEMIFSFNLLCSGLLLRKYVFFPKILLKIIRSEYGNFFGGLFFPLFLLSVFTPFIFAKILFVLFILVDLILGLKKEPAYIIGRITMHYAFLVYVLLGFLFYFPKRKKIEWNEIN